MTIKIKNIIIKKMAFMVIFFSVLTTFGQLNSTDSLANQKPVFTFNQLVVVQDSSSVDMIRAWSGGFRSPQFSEIDVNGDGTKDLFVFDRYDNSISIFVYNNGEYFYQPDYNYFFPALTRWVLLRDYNCDGKNDIFAASIGGVQIWENTTSVGSDLSFTLTTSYLVSSSGPVVIFEGDVPNISDIDDDGDLDILAFGNTGVYVSYYRNRSVDNGNGCDIDFELYTQCWGHFREGGTSSSIILGDDCGGNRPADLDSTQNATMHIGSTITAFDNDGDNDKEVMIGDITSDNLKLLHNGGDINDAVINVVDDFFPLPNPVDMYTYNAGFLIDKDKDGDMDLVVSPADGSESGGRNNTQNLYYENTGTASIPNFQYTQNDFITDKAIEVGAGAAPKLYDYDFDGDLDMLVGNFAYRESPISVESKIALYENIGSVSTPIFQIVDSNYANLNTTSTDLFSKVIEFADLDNDGDDDMLIGSFNGKLRYYENSAGAGQKGVYTLFVDGTNGPNYQGLDVGNNAAPELIDYDRDGDFDLIVGEASGNVNYFENIGTASVPNFNQVTDSLGGINLRNIYYGGHSTPTITDLNGNGNYDLIIGSFDGFVNVYMDVESYSNLEDKYQTQDSTYFNSAAENYTNILFGYRTIPTLGDLDNDGFPEMLVGVYRGGIHYLQNSSDSTIIVNSITEAENLDIKIFPNPSKGLFTIELPNDFGDYKMSIINSIGQQCFFDKNSLNNSVLVDLRTNSNGLYYVIIIKDGNIAYKSKISVLK